jgi:hypothetical protein
LWAAEPLGLEGQLRLSGRRQHLGPAAIGVYGSEGHKRPGLVQAARKGFELLIELPECNAVDIGEHPPDLIRAAQRQIGARQPSLNPACIAAVPQDDSAKRARRPTHPIQESVTFLGVLRETGLAPTFALRCVSLPGGGPTTIARVVGGRPASLVLGHATDELPGWKIAIRLG